jgi:hypothetical protein
MKNKGLVDSWISLTITILLTACASGGRHSTVGERKAGLKTKMHYQSREEILHEMKEKGKIKEDLEVERQLLPIGGWIYLESGSKNGAPLNTHGMPFTIPDFMQVNVDGEFYFACNELESIRIHQGFVSRLFSNPTYHLTCNINRPISSDFDVILMNFSKTPIGKYHFLIKSKS